MKPFEPRHFQRDLAIPHMLDVPRCALHAGCGMGKTVTTLAALDILMLAGEVRKPLVLAPLRVARTTWATEAGKWEQFKDLRVSTITGSATERQQALMRKADIYTANYENLPWLIDRLGDNWDFDCVVADEATKLKGFRLRQGGERTRALGRVAHSKVRRFIELTGTPSPNGVKDLWGQMWFLDGGQRLGRTYSAFEQRWFTRGRDGFSLQPMPHAFEEISTRISDLCLSLSAADYFDMPGTIVNNILVDLPEKAMSLYRDMEKEMFIEIASKGVEAFSAAGKTNKCLQIANGAVYLDDKQTWAHVHDAKIEALESIIEEACGKPLIVAHNFRSDLARLKAKFPKARELKTTADEDDFRAGKIPLLFCHPDSAGHGIDGFQHVTNEIVFFGHNWNLETRHQIIERIGETRQAQAGNRAPVVIHNIIARKTIDEIVLQRIETKREVQDLLIERMKRGV